MTAKLYLVALPDAQTTTSREAVAAQIQQSGLLEGGTATEKIASENIDLVVNGQWRFGETFSKKLADELESLGESSYEGVVFYDPDATDSGRNKGYYELESVDVNPAHPSTRDTFEYSAGLAFTGTKETHWRDVASRVETIQHGLATGTGGLIGVPATASKVRWFDTASGIESASPDSTVAAEFGNVELYDPTQPSFSDPTLIYELAFSDEGETDVRVWDDLDASKYYALPDGTNVAQWVHAYHTAFEFDGSPVIDNGLARVTFDEANGVVDVSEWSETILSLVDSTTNWSSGTNATVSLTTDDTFDGTAVRGDTDAAGTVGDRDITFDPSGTVDLSGVDTVTFWYYTDNAGGMHSLALTDGAASTDTVDFSADVTADTGAFIEVALSGYTNDLSTVDTLQWVFDGPGGEDKYVVVDSIRYGDLAWNQLTIDHSSFSLVDADLTVMGPSDVRAYCEFTSGGSEYAVLSVQRGVDAPVARAPEGETWSAGFETYLDQFVSDQSSDGKPVQGLTPRTELR